MVDGGKWRPAPVRRRGTTSATGALSCSPAVKVACLYLSISADSVRDWDASGVLSPARVRIPAASGRTLSRVLFDRAELDRLIAGWRAPA